MKKFLYIVFILSSFQSIAQQPVREVEKPSPARLVYDKAGVLNAEQVRLLEEQLVALDDSTSNQIAIAIIKTLDGGSLEEVAVNTFREWGIGTAKDNNGVLILVVTDDRKVKIETGYGLEGAISDAMSGSIIRNEMAPYFRQQDYYHGLHNAVEALGRAAAGEYSEARQRDSGGEGGSILKFVLIMMLILFFIGRGGGGRGKRKGSMMTRRGSRGWMGPVFFPGGFGGGGFGGGGGGFGGGGFGGFGGGSSGGGGASGSW